MRAPPRALLHPAPRLTPRRSTHLYGRKLVVEWSEAKDEVQAARERATVDYAAASEAQERQRTARNRKRARESNQ